MQLVPSEPGIVYIQSAYDPGVFTLYLCFVSDIFSHVMGCPMKPAKTLLERTVLVGNKVKKGEICSFVKVKNHA